MRSQTSLDFNITPEAKFDNLKPIIESIITAAKIALKHKKFFRVLNEYIIDTDTFTPSQHR